MRQWPELIKAGHRLGTARNAPLTILEFADYECPACAGFEKTLQAFMTRHPEQVSVVFRNWPLPYHHLAYAAARASECADAQGRYQAFHDILFAVQDSLGILPFDSVAARAGVSDLRTFGGCSWKSAKLDVIERDIAAAHDVGAPGTPTVIANGRMFAALPDSARLESALRAALRSR